MKRTQRKKDWSQYWGEMVVNAIVEKPEKQEMWDKYLLLQSFEFSFVLEKGLNLFSTFPKPLNGIWKW